MNTTKFENNIRKFYGNIGKITVGLPVTGVLTGLALWLIIDILSDFTNFIPLFIIDSMKIPVCLTAGFLMAVVIQVFRCTVVTVSSDTVCIKRLLKKYTFEIDKCYFFEETEYKKHSISMLVFTRYKRFLILKDAVGKVRRIRLYSFSATGLYSLIDEIHKHETEAISDERKAKVIRDSWDNERRLDISVKSIVRCEWKKVWIIVSVWIGITILLTVLLVLTDNDAYHTFELVLMILVSFICVLEIPYELIRTVKNARRCPEYVQFKGEHFMVADDHFIVSDIENLTMTSVDRKSNSIYPVQRYMIIKTDMGKYKYWIGSEASMTVREYKRICAFIRQAFINYPDKLEFKGKRSWLNT
ncbi:MAG: hypothetical protein K2F60_03685 [Oscillospiraceae bacterium]|nr:hypothetical protein [Oscillospiraceae bacterium]